MTTSSIHPTAIIAEGAQIPHSVEIGPYCVLGDHVVLGEGVRLHSHVIVEGHTTIGDQTEIFSFAVIGGTPQSRGYKSEPTRIIIGKNNLIREHVTIHKGTVAGGGVTQIGDDNFLMVGSHVGHDCILGNGITLSNNVLLGGHVVIDDRVVIGGHTAVHQKVSIGTCAMIAGTLGISQDVIPYGFVILNDFGHLDGLNVVGMKRAGYQTEDLHLMRSVFKTLFENHDEIFDVRLKSVRESHGDHPLITTLLDFIDRDRSRPLSQPAKVRASNNLLELADELASIRVA